MNAYELTLSAFEDLLGADGEPRYRAGQVYEGLWRRARDYPELTDLPAMLRDRLAVEVPTQLEVLAEQVADQGATITVNDGSEQAWLLAGIARRLHAHVNLIPLNPTPANPARPSPPESIAGFEETLRAAGVQVTVRDTRGRDIDAACGQLRVTAGTERVSGPT